MHHVALRTRDVERLLTHYVEVCGLTLRSRRPNGSVWLQSGGVVLMIERAEPSEARPAEGSLDLLAFATDEPTDALEQRLAARGAAVEARTEWTVYFRDPDGRRNALSRYRFE